MSREWLSALRVGDVILSRYEDHDDPLEVVRVIIPTRARWGVLMKRKHLKVPMPMMECDDEYVLFQWSSKIGQIQHKFREWKILREGELLNLPLHSPTHPIPPSSHEQTTPTSYAWETYERCVGGLHRVLQNASHASR